MPAKSDQIWSKRYQNHFQAQLDSSLSRSFVFPYHLKAAAVFSDFSKSAGRPFRRCLHRCFQPGQPRQATKKESTGNVLFIVFHCFSLVFHLFFFRLLLQLLKWPMSLRPSRKAQNRSSNCIPFLCKGLEERQLRVHWNELKIRSIILSYGET